MKASRTKAPRVEASRPVVVAGRTKSVTPTVAINGDNIPAQETEVSFRVYLKSYFEKNIDSNMIDEQTYRYTLGISTVPLHTLLSTQEEKARNFASL